MLVVDRRRLQLVAALVVALVVLAPVAAALVALSARSRLTEVTSVGAAAERQARLLALFILLGAGVLAVARPVVDHSARWSLRLAWRWRVLATTTLAAAAILAAVTVAPGRGDFFTKGLSPRVLARCVERVCGTSVVGLRSRHVRGLLDALRRSCARGRCDGRTQPLPGDAG